MGENWGDGFQGNWGFDYQTVVPWILVSQTKIKYITKIKFTKEIYKLKWDAQKLSCTVFLSEGETYE